MKKFFKTIAAGIIFAILLLCLCYPRYALGLTRRLIVKSIEFVTDLSSDLLQQETTSGMQVQAAALLSLPSAPAADPYSRTLNTSLSVGSTAGMFDVSPTGAASYNIPIIVAPGTGGMQPNISIAYSSQGGNGLLGCGWDLSGVISTIKRTGECQYYDGQVKGVKINKEDRFVLDGKRLIGPAATYGNPDVYLYPEVEDFSSVLPKGTTGTGPTYFIVETKDRKKIYYGNYGSSNAYLKSVGSTTIIAWYIARIEDRLGNYMQYNYQRDETNGETWLASIEYTGNSAAAITPYNKVEFTYTTRDDKYTSYVAGCKLTGSKLISNIKTLCEGNVVRQYVPKYYYDEVTKLNEVEEYNAQGQRYNSIVAGYGPKASSLISYMFFPYISEDEGKEIYFGFADFNNDGLTDFMKCVFTGNAENRDFRWEVWMNENGGFSKSQTGTWNFCNVTGFNFVPGDYNADGLTDLAVCVQRDYGMDALVYCFASAGSTLSCAETNYFEVDDIFGVYSGDIGGDAQDDIISLGLNKTYIYKYTTKDLTIDPVKYSLSLSVYGTVSYVCDFNGDGKPDVLSLQNNYLKVWELNLTSYTEIFSSTTVKATNTSRLYPGDFNGDGKTDVLTWNSYYGWKVYLNDDKQFIASTAPGLPGRDMEASPDDHNIFLQDYNRDGQTDILYAYKNGNTSNLEYYFADKLSFTKKTVSSASGWPYVNKQYIKSFSDFNGDGIQDVFSKIPGDGTCYAYLNNNNDMSRSVVAILNGTNSLLEMSYISIASPNNGVYSKGASVEFPLMNFQGPLYVTKTSKEKLPGGTVISDKSYTYSQAKIHRLGKGFLGFGSMFSDDTQTATKLYNYYTTKIVNNKYFYVYPNSTTLNKGGANVSQASRTMSLTELTGGIRFLPFVSAEYKSDNLNEFSIVTTYVSYDSYGNPKKITEEHRKEVDDSYVSEALITKEFTWWPTTKSYLPATAKTTTHRSGQTDNVRNTSITYTSAGLADIIKSDPGTAFEVREDNDYDGCGNITRKRILNKNNAVLRSTSYAFEAKKRFISTITNILGHVVTNTTDPKTGGILTSTNARNITVQNGYDGFGRLTQTTTPEGTSTTAYSWNNTTIENAVFYIQKTGIDNSYGKEYFDAVGRSIFVTRSGFEGMEIHSYKRYNSKGEVWKVSEPYKTGETPYETVYTYDNYGRPLFVVGGGKSTIYSYPELRKTVIQNGLKGSQTRWQIINSLYETIESGDLGGTVKYTYNATGKPVKIEAPGSTTTMEYDLTGNQTRLIDPDAGTITYEYDILGQMTKQTDAQGQVYSMAFDNLGRLTSQTNTSEGTNTYTYASSGNGLGLIQSVTNSITQVAHNYVYDALARVSSESETIAGAAYTYSYTYDTKGRVAQMDYPGGFGIKMNYGTSGELYKVTGTDNSLIWEIEEMGSLGELKEIRYGNGTVTNYSYNIYHKLSEILTTNAQGTKRQHLQYSYETATGNMLWRKDLLAMSGAGIKEDFTYDDPDRLTSYKAGINPAYTINYNTDGSGRFTAKSDLGTYAYGSAGSKPHALTGITGSDGSVVSHTAQTVAYTPFQKAKSITEGTANLQITYGPDRARKITELYNSGSLVKKKIFAGNLYELEEDASGTRRHLYYVPGPSGEAAIFVKVNSGTVTPYYIHKDHQGSYQTITNSSGVTVETLSFDPWGRRRNAVNWTYTSVPTSFAFDRGYTGHEHLDIFALINMNGRIYDPATGHFLSPDNYVQNPNSTQSFNRYGYCINNPLKYTDPDGNIFALLSAWLLFTDSGYEVQKHFSPISIHADVKIGSHQTGLGFDLSVGIPTSVPVSYQLSYGKTYYWETLGGHSGWETRQGGEWTILGFMKYSGTTFSGVNYPREQTTNTITFGGPFMNAQYENDTYLGSWDWIPWVPIGDPSSDAYRTAAVRIKAGPLSMGLTLHTGEATGYDWIDTDGDGIEERIMTGGNISDASQSHGIFYCGFGPLRIGRDTENIRHFFQNKVAHDGFNGGSRGSEYPWVSKTEYYSSRRDSRSGEWKERKSVWYFQFGWSNGSTLY